MCGRYTLRTPMTVLAKQFQFDLDATTADVGPRYNIAPTQLVLAVRVPETGARADSVASKPAFRSAFKKRRCLVLADGYYEWHTEGKLKQPFLFELDGGQPFALAGLWEWWRDPAAPDRDRKSV